MNSDLVEIGFHNSSDDISGEGHHFPHEDQVHETPDEADKASQFPEMVQARQGYESVEGTRKRDLQAQMIEEKDTLL